MGEQVVVIRASPDQLSGAKFWPISEPDQIETIAASYVQPSGNNTASVRLFNLSPSVGRAGMASSVAGSPVPSFFSPFEESPLSCVRLGSVLPKIYLYWVRP